MQAVEGAVFQWQCLMIFIDVISFCMYEMPRFGFQQESASQTGFLSLWKGRALPAHDPGTSSVSMTQQKGASR